MEKELQRREITLNHDTDILKILAMITMVIDHVGVLFMYNDPLYRGIGRLAFPLFCYCLAVGCRFSRNMGKYALRLLIGTLVCQPIYVLAMNHQTPAMLALDFSVQPVWTALRWYVLSFRYCNIFGELLLGQLMIWALQKRFYIGLAVVLAGSLCLDVAKVLSMSYGYRGLILILLMYVCLNNRALFACAVGSFMIWWGLQYTTYTLSFLHYGIQIYAVCAVPLMLLPVKKRHIRLPKWIGYAFYPAHLAVLYILRLLSA